VSVIWPTAAAHSFSLIKHTHADTHAHTDHVTQYCFISMAFSDKPAVEPAHTRLNCEVWIKFVSQVRYSENKWFKLI